MRIGKALTAVAVATSLISTPVFAGAENLSVTSAQRDAAPVGEGENIRGGGKIIITLLAISIIIGGIIVFLRDNDENLPTSP